MRAILPSRSGRCRAACALILVTAISIAAPATIRACSMVGPTVRGGWWTGSSWVFSVFESNGAFTLLERSPEGVLLEERVVIPRPADLPADSQLWPTAPASGGDFWFGVSCPARDDDPRCGGAVRVDRDGAVVDQRVRPPATSSLTSFAPAGRPPVRRFLGSALLDGALEIWESASVPAEVRPVHRRTVPPDFPNAGAGARWHLGEDGSVLLHAETGREIRFVRLDPEGRIAFDRTYPRPRSTDLEPDPEALDRPRGGSLLLEDGRTVLGQGTLGGDCSLSRSPALIFLDAGGAIERTVELDGMIEQLAMGDERILVVQGSRARVFDLGGDEVASFLLEPEAWRAERDESQEIVEEVDAASDPALLERAFGFARSGRRDEIREWLVASWTPQGTDLGDSTWWSLGEDLCASHPAAAGRALERFRASEGQARELWLGILASCFDEPPPGLLEEVRRLEEQRGRDVAWRARHAWGPDPAGLEALWTKARQELSDGRPDRPALGGRDRPTELVRALPHTGPRLEQWLLHGAPGERTAARTVVLLAVSGPMEVALLPARARADLQARAAVWAVAEDPALAPLGRLVLLALGRAPLVEALPVLLADARRDPAWVAPLGEVVAAAGSTDVGLDLPPALEEDLAALLATGPGAPGHFGGLPVVFEQVGSAGRRPVLTAAVAPEAPAVAFERLLELVADEPRWFSLDELAEVLRHPRFVQLVEGPPTLRRLGVLEATWRLRGEGKLRDAAAGLFAHAVSSVSADLPQILKQIGFRGGVFGPRQPEDGAIWSTLPPSLAAALLDLPTTDPDEWMWLIGRVGAWPEVEELVRAALAEGSLSAALALAPLRDPEALEVLLRAEWPDLRLAEALAHYGESVVRRLEGHLDHRRPATRWRVRRLLANLGPSASTVERVEAEARTLLEEGELPDPGTVLLLHRAGRPILDRIVANLVATPDRSWPYSWTRTVDVELVRLLGRRLLEVSGDERTALRELLADHSGVARAEARYWLLRDGEARER